MIDNKYNGRRKIKLALSASILAVSLISLSISSPLTAQKNQTEADKNTNSIAEKIKKEGSENSQAEILAHELVNGIGARLSNSPQMRQAEKWTVDKFTSWGLTNVRKEGFEFGDGWSVNHSNVSMISPRNDVLNATPKGWSPSTDGPLQAGVVPPFDGKKPFEIWINSVKGKFVFIDGLGEANYPTESPYKRFSAEDLEEFEKFEGNEYNIDNNKNIIRFLAVEQNFAKLVENRGAAGLIYKSRNDGELLHGEGFGIKTAQRFKIPAVELSDEDYRRVAALASKTPNVMMTVDNDVTYHTEDSQAYNIVAEIQGSDPNAGHVILSAHYDSWIGGDGATDNGAGTVMVMEAARILSKLKIKPKRTIKFILWAAEEQGLVGSIAYTEKHIASRPAGADDISQITSFFEWPSRFPITKQKDFGNMKALFNIDNGSGKIRGIYAAGHTFAIPVLNEWLGEYKDEKLVAYPSAAGGLSDDVIMHNLGLPSYKFIQDPLEYSTVTHHTNADTYSHLQFDDIKQSSVIAAITILAAANSNNEIPLRPLPKAP